MRTGKGLISSILTFFVTVMLFIFTAFGWYTTNNQVNTSGISGAVLENQLVKSVEYYNFLSKSVNSGFTTLKIDEHDYRNVNMKQYDDLVVEPTEFLIKINLSDTVDISRITMTSNANYFVGFPNKVNPGYITSRKNLSLSSVIEGYILDDSYMTETEDEITYKTPSQNDYKKFTYNNDTGAIVIKEIELISEKRKDDVIYIMLNYNQDALNDLFGNNIGNEVVEESEEGLDFKFDFKILVI